MKTILSILEEIRNHQTEHEQIGGYFLPDDLAQSLLAALDTAEDAALAMRAYEDTPFTVDAFGENYLRLYGFLQAIFLQQDSIREIRRCFFAPKPDNRNLPDWGAIRELRNRVTGHPANFDNGGRAYLNRVSLTQWFFQYQYWDKTAKTAKHEDVDLRQMYDGYKRDAAILLREVLYGLRAKHGKTLD